MNTQRVRSRDLEEVRNTVVAIARALDSLGNQSTCVLHCMQPRRASFYSQLEQDFGIRVLICGPHSGLGAILRKATLGAPALLVVDDHSGLPALFARIGEQAMAGLYVVTRGGAAHASLGDLATGSASEVAAAIKGDSAHLLYQVDEDSATHSGHVVEVLSAGASCPQVLKDAVGMEMPNSDIA